jgi:hypothetical protein
VFWGCITASDDQRGKPQVDHFVAIVIEAAPRSQFGQLLLHFAKYLPASAMIVTRLASDLATRKSSLRRSLYPHVSGLVVSIPADAR